MDFFFACTFIKEYKISADDMFCGREKAVRKVRGLIIVLSIPWKVFDTGLCDCNFYILEHFKFLIGKAVYYSGFTR